MGREEAYECGTPGQLDVLGNQHLRTEAELTAAEIAVRGGGKRAVHAERPENAALLGDTDGDIESDVAQTAHAAEVVVPGAEPGLVDGQRDRRPYVKRLLRPRCRVADAEREHWLKQLQVAVLIVGTGQVTGVPVELVLELQACKV